MSLRTLCASLALMCAFAVPVRAATEQQAYTAYFTAVLDFQSAVVLE